MKIVNTTHSVVVLLGSNWEVLSIHYPVNERPPAVNDKYVRDRALSELSGVNIVRYTVLRADPLLGEKRGEEDTAYIVTKEYAEAHKQFYQDSRAILLLPVKPVYDPRCRIIGYEALAVV